MPGPAPNGVHSSVLSIQIDGVYHDFETSSLTESAGKVDVTGNLSGGRTEHIYDPIDTTFSYSIMLRPTTIPSFRPAEFYPAVWKLNGVVSYTGTIGIDSVRPAGGAKGRARFEGDASFTGSVVVATG
jgi:hypothetical protein